MLELIDSAYLPLWKAIWQIYKAVQPVYKNQPYISYSVSSLAWYGT